MNVNIHRHCYFTGTHINYTFECGVCDDDECSEKQLNC